MDVYFFISILLLLVFQILVMKQSLFNISEDWSYLQLNSTLNSKVMQIETVPFTPEPTPFQEFSNETVPSILFSLPTSIPEVTVLPTLQTDDRVFRFDEPVTSKTLLDIYNFCGNVILLFSFH